MAAATAGPSRATRFAMRVALGAALVALIAHTWIYRFLTDDAFISFRYAVNFSHGHGLVFNPGIAERVEGYSNFLWVILLAGLDRLGIVPEMAANPLSFLATLALWFSVAWFAWRGRRPGEPVWPCLVPPALLAITRSFAVWSSSGLETRLFEALIVCGALRLVVEVEAWVASAMEVSFPGIRPVASLLFALACLTRPDGLLLAMSAFGIATVFIGMRAPRALIRFLLTLVPFVVLVGGHYLFRRYYYGEWLPNTYYAKVDGRTWWSSGITYFTAFFLEYAVWLWAPLVIAGIVLHLRRRTSFVPLLLMALIVPHAIYVASIGGDHFEYRPIDLYFPFLYLLLADGARLLARGWAASLAVFLWIAASAFGIWDLAWRSHMEYTKDYSSGFPGMTIERTEVAHDFLDPDRDPVYRLPVLRSLALAHRDRLRALSGAFVAIRQEEHRMFLASVIPDGVRLNRMVEAGLLPRDLYVAMSSVGAIPYYSGVRTLDRLGLTDAHVAHSRGGTRHRVMAHDKSATLEYMHERGVDMVSVDPVHIFQGFTSPRLLFAVKDALVQGDSAWAAAVSDTDFIVAVFPIGPEAAMRRMPRLRFQMLNDPVFVRRYVEGGVAAYRAQLERNPTDADTGRKLAYLLLVGSRFHEAIPIYLALVSAIPQNPANWENLAACYAGVRDWDHALETLDRSIEATRAIGWTYDLPRLAEKRAEYVREAGATKRR
jgi:arabinofuranosyltransferase